jgi:hypothetical protein
MLQRTIFRPSPLHSTSRYICPSCQHAIRRPIPSSRRNASRKPPPNGTRAPISHDKLDELRSKNIAGSRKLRLAQGFANDEQKIDALAQKQPINIAMLDSAHKAGFLGISGRKANLLLQQFWELGSTPNGLDLKEICKGRVNRFRVLSNLLAPFGTDQAQT